MKNWIFKLFSLLHCVLKASGQENIISNPSFENISNCPGVYALADLASDWAIALVTPDLYNSCAPQGAASVPLNNVNCFQYARTGNGYVGIESFYTIGRTTEYIEGKLLNRLEAGKEYYIEFHVSPRNRGNYEICYSDGMGIAFSDKFYYEDVIVGGEQIPPFLPVVQNPIGNILKDTINWIKISGCYTANGTETYAILGNFRSSANTNSLGCIGVTGSYHYIDDVGVYMFDPLPDTLLLCKDMEYSIGHSFLDASYLWNTGETDSVISINKGGSYILSASMGNCILTDTVLVLEIDDLLKTLPADTIICIGQVLDINMPVLSDFVWSNGGENNKVEIDSPGMYYFSFESSCGAFNHYFEVSVGSCECNIFVPNIVSLNNDGANDYVECIVGCDFPYRPFRFQVFDRWGEIVYSKVPTDNQSISWDGVFRGKPLDLGVYCWCFEYEYSRDGKLNSKTICGDFTIVK